MNELNINIDALEEFFARRRRDVEESREQHAKFIKYMIEENRKEEIFKQDHLEDIDFEL